MLAKVGVMTVVQQSYFLFFPSMSYILKEIVSSLSSLLLNNNYNNNKYASFLLEITFS